MSDATDAKLRCLTVGQLIEALSKFDKNLEVWTEGCDCIGEAFAVKELGDDSVLIVRPSGI